MSKRYYSVQQSRRLVLKESGQRGMAVKADNQPVAGSLLTFGFWQKSSF
ncbi:MAG: hypothetical protein ACYCY7_01970 [Gallionella sp.]